MYAVNNAINNATIEMNARHQQIRERHIRENTQLAMEFEKLRHNKQNATFASSHETEMQRMTKELARVNKELAQLQSQNQSKALPMTDSHAIEIKRPDYQQLVVEILSFKKNPKIILRDRKTPAKEVQPSSCALVMQISEGFAYEFSFKVRFGECYDVMILDGGRYKPVDGIVKITAIKHMPL